MGWSILPARRKYACSECAWRPFSTVACAAANAWPSTCPPNTYLVPMSRLWPRNRLSSRRSSDSRLISSETTGSAVADKRLAWACDGQRVYRPARGAPRRQGSGLCRRATRPCSAVCASGAYQPSMKRSSWINSGANAARRSARAIARVVSIGWREAAAAPAATPPRAR